MLARLATGFRSSWICLTSCSCPSACSRATLQDALPFRKGRVGLHQEKAAAAGPDGGGDDRQLLAERVGGHERFAREPAVAEAVPELIGLREKRVEHGKHVRERERGALALRLDEHPDEPGRQRVIAHPHEPALQALEHHELESRADIREHSIRHV